MNAHAKCPRCKEWDCKCDQLCHRCATELAGRKVYSLSTVHRVLICGGCLTAEEALRATPHE